MCSMEHGPRGRFIIHVSGPFTMGPYGRAGTCIINYATPEIHVVVMALFDCLPQYQPYITISAAYVIGLP